MSTRRRIGEERGLSAATPGLYLRGAPPCRNIRCGSRRSRWTGRCFVAYAGVETRSHLVEWQQRANARASHAGRLCAARYDAKEGERVKECEGRRPSPIVASECASEPRERSAP